jgi:hypothetical protein
VAAAETPGPKGDRAEFVVLPDGTLLGEPEEVPLADALALEPPYRAEAVRRGSELWAVAARRIEVVELPEDVEGEQVELTVVGGERTLTVDGARIFGSIPELERLRDGDFAVRARRLDEALWEVEAARL